MCASLYIDRLVSRFRFILLTLTLAIAALNPMQDASAQSDLAAMNQQVIRLYQSGQKTEAIALAEKTVAIARQRLGADNKVTGILLSQLGNLYRDTGRFADAENALKTAVAILERTGSGPNFELAQALNNLGGVYLNQDMFSDAEKLFQRSSRSTTSCRRASSATSCAATASTISPFSTAPKPTPKPKTARPKAPTKPMTR
jgi:tetratricopeptide (TPR) repeat protein